jgi:hypothetical protein
MIFRWHTSGFSVTCNLLLYQFKCKTAYLIVIRTEKALIKSGLFKLPGKKILYPSKNPIETVAVDVSEHEIERPQKKQKKYYSGKQKYHTIKSQVLANPKTAEIICTAFSNGKTHDFSLF